MSMFRTAFTFDEVSDFIRQLENYPENVHIASGIALAEWSQDVATGIGNQSVFDWDSRPEWIKDTEIDQDLTITSMWGTTDDVWNWLDQGTGLYGERRSKYPIVAKNAPYLVFRTGYVAKTTPGKVSGGSRGGFYTGPLRRKRKVMHPGIKPRGWFDMIYGFVNTNWFSEYLVFLEEAMLDGLQQAASNVGTQYRGGRL